MPNFSRLELKPSPREFDIHVFSDYYVELKKSEIRLRLFYTVLKSRNFEALRVLNEDQEKAETEINQCLIEALDIALHTPEDALDEEFETFDQKFRVNIDQYTSPMTYENTIFF